MPKGWPRLREIHRADWLALRDFTAALTKDDLALLRGALQQIEERGLWRRAMLAAARLAPLSAVMQQRFLSIWLSGGDYIRQETLDDAALVDGLRVLLPA